MKRKQIAILLGAVLLLAAAAPALIAQTSKDFNLTWHGFGSGGGQSTSADYRVHGTIGQHIAPPVQSSSADFRVTSGFWFEVDAMPTPHAAHLPLIR